MKEQYTVSITEEGTNYFLTLLKKGKTDATYSTNQKYEDIPKVFEHIRKETNGQNITFQGKKTIRTTIEKAYEIYKKTNNTEHTQRFLKTQTN